MLDRFLVNSLIENIYDGLDSYGTIKGFSYHSMIFIDFGLTNFQKKELFKILKDSGYSGSIVNAHGLYIFYFSLLFISQFVAVAKFSVIIVVKWFHFRACLIC